MAEGGMITALVDYSLDYSYVYINIFKHLFIYFFVSSKTAQPLTDTNQSSLLTKCQVIIPKEVEQSINESAKRVNK